MHLNGESRGLAVEQGKHFVDNCVHVKQFTLCMRLSVEGTYPIDDLRRTFPISVDSGRGCAGPVDVWRVVRKPFDATVGAGDGSSDWLLDFVRQGRGHFPHHAHTI